MASMRVHELAKEFDMSSKELLDKLHEMKIPAKSHASMLADAYVAKIRKNLEPEIKQRAGQLEDEEAKKLAEAFGLELFDADRVYALVKEGGRMPQKLISPPEKRNGAKEKFRFRIRRSAWKGYLLSGGMLLLFSLVTVFPVYYVVSGSVLLTIAVLVRFFGKKE